jgi:type I restriction enzyme R subunit
MNTRFTKFVTVLDNGDPDEIERVKNELHSTFASLTSEEQKFANIFLVDIESGKVHIEEGKLFKDYVNEYMQREKDDIIHQVAVALGVDEEQLREFKKEHISEADIDKFGRFTALKASVEISVAKAYFEKRDGKTYITPRVRQQLDASLRNFILYDIF